MVASITSEDTAVIFDLENVHLWHGRKDPYLYTAEVALIEGKIFSLTIYCAALFISLPFVLLKKISL